MNMINENIVIIDGVPYDFNTYPIYQTPMNPQLFLLPSDDESMEDCYIIRDSDDKNTPVVSHNMFATKLVQSVPFAKRERKEQLENPNAKSWVREKDYYDQGRELEYLIQEKGYIPFSTPSFEGELDYTIPDSFFPTDKTLMTKRQIANLFTMIDLNPKVHLSPHMENELMSILNRKTK